MENLSTLKKLSDKCIRTALKSYLASKTISPIKIVEEMGIHNGNARADLVAFYDHLHCFEIKSDLDTLRRLHNQATYYDFTFKKITLVVSDKFESTVQTAIPSHWGILVAKQSPTGYIKFSTIRRPKRNPNWKADKALLSLWKGELLEINEELKISVKKSSSREKLALEISEKMNKSVIETQLYQKLLLRSLSELKKLTVTY